MCHVFIFYLEFFTQFIEDWYYLNQKVCKKTSFVCWRGNISLRMIQYILYITGDGLLNVNTILTHSSIIIISVVHIYLVKLLVT